MQNTAGLGADTLSVSPPVPVVARVARWPCLAGDPAPQTVPSPCGVTGGMEGHWDRAGGCTQGRNCSSSKVCLRVTTALCPVALGLGQPWLPCALLLPGELGSGALDHPGGMAQACPPTWWV